MTEIKPCPFCGQTPNVYGRKRRDYVNSIWADQEEEEYWVKPNCLPMCFLGNIHATAFGFVDGMKYRSPELAIKVWNKRWEEIKKCDFYKKKTQYKDEYCCCELSRDYEDCRYYSITFDMGANIAHCTLNPPDGMEALSYCPCIDNGEKCDNYISKKDRMEISLQDNKEWLTRY